MSRSALRLYGAPNLAIALSPEKARPLPRILHICVTQTCDMRTPVDIDRKEYASHAHLNSPQ